MPGLDELCDNCFKNHNVKVDRRLNVITNKFKYQRRLSSRLFLGTPCRPRISVRMAQIPKSENYRLELKFPVAKRFLFCFSFTGKKPSVG